MDGVSPDVRIVLFVHLPTAHTSLRVCTPIKQDRAAACAFIYARVCTASSGFNHRVGRSSTDSPLHPAEATVFATVGVEVIVRFIEKIVRILQFSTPTHAGSVRVPCHTYWLSGTYKPGRLGVAIPCSIYMYLY